MPLKPVGPRRATWHALTQHNNQRNLHCHYSVKLALCICFFSFFFLLLLETFKLLYFFLPCAPDTRCSHLLLCVWRQPTQVAWGCGQTRRVNPALVTSSGRGCEPGCLREANVILRCVSGVRHILPHSTPPPLPLYTDVSLSCLILPFPSCQSSQNNSPKSWGIILTWSSIHKDFSLMEHHTQKKCILLLWCTNYNI